MLTLYGHLLSAPTNKVRYIANYINLAYTFKIVDLLQGEHQKAEYKAINPLGKIPALSDDGFVVAESNAIIRYLANKYDSNLYPDNIQAKAIIDQWLDYASQHIMVPFAKITWNLYFCKLLGDGTTDDKGLKEGHHFLNRNLPVVEDNLNKHDYIAGSDITIADFAMLASMDTAEACEVDLNKYPAIIAWRNKLMSEDFYTKCHKNYMEVLQKFIK